MRASAPGEGLDAIQGQRGAGARQGADMEIQDFPGRFVKIEIGAGAAAGAVYVGAARSSHAVFLSLVSLSGGLVYISALHYCEFPERHLAYLFLLPLGDDIVVGVCLRYGVTSFSVPSCLFATFCLGFWCFRIIDWGKAVVC